MTKVESVIPSGFALAMRDPAERERAVREYRALLRRAWQHRHGFTGRTQVECAVARLRTQSWSGERIVPLLMATTMMPPTEGGRQYRPASGEYGFNTWLL